MNRQLINREAVDSEKTNYYHSPIGILQIKSSEQYIREIWFINSEKGPQLQPAELKEDKKSPLVKTCMRQLDEYFAGNRQVFDFPFQQEGTPFQETVWNALLDIPYGKTISYLELSKRIGNPKAIRAVGTTNGKNQISIVVPCHRVIGANGSLVGYGGDLWRKKWLLEHEDKVANGVQKLGEW